MSPKPCKQGGPTGCPEPAFMGSQIRLELTTLSDIVWKVKVRFLQFRRTPFSACFWPLSTLITRWRSNGIGGQFKSGDIKLVLDESFLGSVVSAVISFSRMQPVTCLLEFAFINQILDTGSFCNQDTSCG